VAHDDIDLSTNQLGRVIPALHAAELPQPFDERAPQEQRSIGRSTRLKCPLPVNARGGDGRSNLDGI
jgi:hypothetical protein